MSMFAYRVNSTTDYSLNRIPCAFQEYMPAPPSEDGENTTPNVGPKLQFSYVECLVYAFHQLARKCPEFLTADEEADRLKDFKMRYV